MTEKKRTNQRLVIMVIVLLVVLLAAVCYLLVQTRMNSNAGEEVLSDPKLAYAEGTTVVRDSNALQNAVDEMAERLAKGNVVLEYETEASSSDGQTFSCYLANATENIYDMYFDMYADDALQDEIYLSGLLRPGSALNEIKLSRKLDAGDHTVYMAFTTVEDDHETLHGQVVVTMTLHVGKK